MLVIYAHPVPTSFNSAVFGVVKESLRSAGHDVRVVDLYAENFQPVLSREDREAYLENTEQLTAKFPEHIENLRWAEGLVFVFPTWYYGPPAILKGWFERVWLPGVTFQVATQKGQTTSSCIRHIRRLAVITTSGSPAWWMWVIGNPCKRLFTRGLRALFNLRCKTAWLQLYEMNVINEDARKKFLKKVEHRMLKL
jgi:putative NADPH-quinone reductase